VRREWGNADYWAWWWRNQVSPDAKIVAAVVAIGLLGIGGYVAANGLESSVAGAEAGGAEVEIVTTTVQRLVTVRAGGGAGGAGRGAAGPTQTVVRQVQVAGPSPPDGRVTDRVTQVRVRTVAGEEGTRVVTQRQVVPVVRREVVTVAGDVRTVVQQTPGGTETRTVERPVDRVVTQERVVTVVVPRTVTETVVVTVNTPVTVTVGPVTLTVTLPLPPLIPTGP
jgi:hypothetical protein